MSERCIRRDDGRRSPVLGLGRGTQTFACYFLAFARSWSTMSDTVLAITSGMRAIGSP